MKVHTTPQQKKRSAPPVAVSALRCAMRPCSKYYPSETLLSGVPSISHIGPASNICIHVHTYTRPLRYCSQLIRGALSSHSHAYAHSLRVQTRITVAAGLRDHARRRLCRDLRARESRRCLGGGMSAKGWVVMSFIFCDVWGAV